jgi:cytosolic carboxypeptidase protein 6
MQGFGIPIDSSDYFETKRRQTRSDSLAVNVSIRLSLKPDTVWVSAQELQTGKHVFSWIKEMTRKPFISYEEIARSKEGRPLYVLNIGKKTSKKMIMVISRQHPPEVTGYLAMRSFVEALSDNTPLAREFRERYSIYVVPLMNPDGVENGHWRHNAGGIDLNRDWTKFNQPEDKLVSNFIKKREKATNGKFYFGIDFHSTYGDIYYTVDSKLPGNMPGLVHEWLTNLKAAFPGYDPKIDPNDKMEPAIISRNYFFVSHGMEALVYEVGDNTAREDLKLKGKTGAIELMKLMLSKK